LFAAEQKTAVAQAHQFHYKELILKIATICALCHTHTQDQLSLYCNKILLILFTKPYP